MNSKRAISTYALFIGVMGLSQMPGYAAIRIGNASHNYANAYSQLNLQNNNPRSSADQVNTPTTASTVSDETVAASALPVRVANARLAEQIRRGDTSAGVDISDLERCAAVYPGGEFEWGKSDGGNLRGMDNSCVSVVELRAVGAGPVGNDLVLARANVSTGDAIRCNISDFPESSYTPDAGNFIFPADDAPTTDDVIKVMNQEQKQNAGVKILATALIGAAAGNMSGDNAPGKDGLFGTSDSKIKNTVVGALGGGALGAAGSYSGKIAGDTIMSAGVNAAAGGIVGNVLATGDSVLLIEPCIDTNNQNAQCLMGYVMKTQKVDSTASDKEYYYNIKDDNSIECVKQNNRTQCTYINLIKIKLDKNTLDTYKNFDEAKRNNFIHIAGDKYTLDKSDPYNHTITTNPMGDYIKIQSAEIPGQQEPAAIIVTNNKASGWTKQDFDNDTTKKDIVGANPIIYGRDGRGKLGDWLPKGDKSYKITDFYPIMQNASDGGIIDLNNKARTKTTLVGAGVGGGLGALTGYEGAKNDIQQRWLAAKREYDDSLLKVVCFTGTRYLGHYNEVLIIPAMKTAE